MRRDQVLHVARAAAQVAGVRRVLIVGSQAVLGTHHEDDLPAGAIVSMEADVIVLDDPRGDAAQKIDGAIGYMSLFHRTNDYYADGVTLAEVTLPAGWEERCFSLSAAGEAAIEAIFPELHDLCAAKLGAGRPQDRRFVQALHGHVLGDGTPVLDQDRLATATSRLPRHPAGLRDRAMGLAAALARGGSIVIPPPGT